MGQVIPADQITEALATFRGASGAPQKTVVTTNGCFDILHVGHLRYLQAARQFGDALVVALNSDDSVRRLKGPERPVNNQDDRAELLAGLNCVDFVVIFNEDTPENLLKKITPNVHVKGGDYTAESLPEADTLKAMGTRMEFVSLVPGRSTTNIIEKMKTT